MRLLSDTTLLIYYEALLLDPVAELTRFSQFLGFAFDPRDINTAVHSSSADTMKKLEKNGKLDPAVTARRGLGSIEKTKVAVDIVASPDAVARWLLACETPEDAGGAQSADGVRRPQRPACSWVDLIAPSQISGWWFCWHSFRGLRPPKQRTTGTAPVGQRLPTASGPLEPR